jgi:hypothetical protein
VKTQIERRSGTLKITLFSIAVISLFAAMPASFASTSHIVYATGGFVFTNTVIAASVGPQKTTLLITAADTLSGALNGTYVSTGIAYVYPNNVCVLRGNSIFTGTLGSSLPGTAVVAGVATGVCTPGGGWQATIHFSDGTGGLAGLRGSLEFEGTFTTGSTGVGTYQGILHLG